MNEGENSGIPNSPNFSSPNISSNGGVNTETQAAPAQQAVTSSDISAMAGTDAGSVAAAAAAMPENDMPTAISSGPSLSASSNDSGRNRFNFGSRRFHGSSSNDQPKAPMFAGAPDYFNQAAGDIELAGYGEEKKSKKPFIIGGIVAAAVVVLGVVIALVIPKSASTSAVKKYEEIKQLATDYSDSVRYYEAYISGAKQNLFSLLPAYMKEEDYKTTIAKLSNNYEKVSEFKQKIDSAGTVDIVDQGTSLNIKDQIAGLKTALNDRMPVYEEYSKVLTAFYKASYSRADDSSIKELKEAFKNQENGEKISSKIKSYFTQRKSYDKSLASNNCYANQNTPTCTSIILSITTLDDSYSADRSLSAALLSIVPENTRENNPTNYLKVISNATVKRKETNEKKD